MPRGFVLVRAVADEAEILTLAVAPTHRQRGIAAALLREAITVLRPGGTKTLFLEVAADNTAALALYAGAGFSPSGRRVGYYARDEGNVDALMMMQKF